MISQNLYIVKGEAKNFPMNATNSSGGTIDLTDALITFTVKASVSDTVPTFQRKNTAAGGNDNEVQITSATDGLLLVKVSSTNSLGLDVKAYYYDCQVNDGTNYVIYSGSLIVQQSVYDGATVARTYGTTAQRPSLTTSDIGYMYFDTTINAPVWWNGATWSDQ